VALSCFLYQPFALNAALYPVSQIRTQTFEISDHPHFSPDGVYAQSDTFLSRLCAICANSRAVMQIEEPFAALNDLRAVLIVVAVAIIVLFLAGVLRCVRLVG